MSLQGERDSKPGMRSIEVRLPADTGEADLIARVDALSRDPDIDGILVQLPLPKHISEAAVLAAIDPLKDVDGLTEASAGKLVLGKPGLRPCTPVGCVILAKTERPDLTGANVVVIGRSILVGKPAALLVPRAERHRHLGALEDARSAHGLPRRRHSRRRGRPARNGQRRLDQPRRHRHRCRHQPRARA